MADWHWVQTHLLSAFADSEGHATISDVLGSNKHNIGVFADPSHQTPIRLNRVRVFNNGREIALTRV